MLPAYAAGAWLGGVVGVAAAAAVCSPLLWLVLVHYTLRKLGVTLPRFLASSRPVVFALTTMIAAVLLVRRTMGETALYLRLGASIATGVVAYAATLWLLSPPARLAQLREIVGHLRRAPEPAERGPGEPRLP
jgi:hypothetical protein